MTTYNNQFQEQNKIEDGLPRVVQEYLNENIAENQEHDLSSVIRTSVLENLQKNVQPKGAHAQNQIQPYTPTQYQLDQVDSISKLAHIQRPIPSEVTYPLYSSDYNQPHQQLSHSQSEIPINANHLGNQSANSSINYSSPPQYPTVDNLQQNQLRLGWLRINYDSSRMITANNDRRSFIIKVYALLCCQLTFTAIFVGIVCGVSKLRDGIKDLGPLAIACWGMTVVILMAIFFTKKYSKRYPYNYLAMFLFTLFESYVVAFICAFSDPLIVLFAAVSTFALTLVLTIYACWTKTDFTIKWGFLLVTTILLIIFGISMIWLNSKALYAFFWLLITLSFAIFWLLIHN